MLIKDPAKRIKVREIIEHPYVKGSVHVPESPLHIGPNESIAHKPGSGSLGGHFLAAHALKKITKKMIVDLRVSKKGP